MKPFAIPTLEIQLEFSKNFWRIPILPAEFWSEIIRKQLTEITILQEFSKNSGQKSRWLQLMSIDGKYAQIIGQHDIDTKAGVGVSQKIMSIEGKKYPWFIKVLDVGAMNSKNVCS